jgi:hypothetical protein
VADVVDFSERFMFLDCVMMMDRQGPSFLERVAGADPSDEIHPTLVRNFQRINWDPALRAGNRLYDRMASALRLQDRAARAKQMATIDSDIKELRGDVAKVALRILMDPDAAPDALGKTVGDIMITLLVPAVSKVHQASDRREQIMRNVQVAFALSAYQRDNGQYPKKLEVLTPKYLAKVPQDLFTGSDLVYLPSENGYLLYSFGVNGRDDQGRSYDDNPPSDDLSVRIPVPALPRK